MKNRFKVEVGNWPFDHFVTTLSGITVAKLKMPNYSTSVDTLQGTLDMNEDNIKVVENAKLLASAPELLESLISLKERLNYLISTGRVDINESETMRDINIANDVIKYATE